ncbi:hypothetical protein HAU32_11445, partial [Weissella confusa]
LSDDGLFIETSSVAKYTGYGIQTMVIRLYEHDLNFGDIPTSLVIVISTSLAPIGQGFAFAAFTDDIEMIAGGVGFKHYALMMRFRTSFSSLVKYHHRSIFIYGYTL